MYSIRPIHISAREFAESSDSVATLVRDRTRWSISSRSYVHIRRANLIAKLGLTETSSSAAKVRMREAAAVGTPLLDLLTGGKPTTSGKRTALYAARFRSRRSLEMLTLAPCLLPRLKDGALFRSPVPVIARTKKSISSQAWHLRKASSSHLEKTSCLLSSVSVAARAHPSREAPMMFLTPERSFLIALRASCTSFMDSSCLPTSVKPESTEKMSIAAG